MTDKKLSEEQKAEGWIEWRGGECPVASDTGVEFRMNDGGEARLPALCLDWRHIGGSSDIVAYRVAQPTKPSTEPGRAVNPKDAIGSVKLPLHLWPAEATALGCLGMLEGEKKYGRNNMIAGDGVVASIYIDAAKRHLDAWFAGEENAPDTGTPHLANALATIAIVVKCLAHGKLIDDRDYAPEPGGAGYRRFVDEITPHVARITKLFANKSPRHYTIEDVK